MNKKVLVIYHSQSNKVDAMAGSVCEGIRLEDADLRFLKAAEADACDLQWCDGLIIGSPENFGYMAGMIKDFFDRTYYKVVDLELNLPYALFVGAGNDGSGASREIQRIAKGYPFRLISEPYICNTALTDQHLADCRDLGQAFAAGLLMGIF